MPKKDLHIGPKEAVFYEFLGSALGGIVAAGFIDLISNSEIYPILSFAITALVTFAILRKFFHNDL